MKIITLDQHWSIESDTNQYTLKRREEKGINEKSGKPTISTEEYYYGRLDIAVSSYVNKRLKEGDGNWDVPAVVDELREILAGVETSVKKWAKID